MPLARINLSKDTPSHSVRSISDVVYEAMIGVANVPVNDRFQIISQHSSNELIFPVEGYLGIDYSPGIVFIQITWNAGRSIETKKAFYRAVAEGIHQRTGIRMQDVWISLIDVQREDWSFGNGEMQYAPSAD